MKTMTTKTMLALGGFVATLTTAGALLAADYPSQRIEIIVPFDAGSGVDAGARLLADSFKATFGTDFTVLNVSGAGGTVGSQRLADASPDGLTLGYLPIGSAATQPHLRPLRYSNESFAPVCLTVKSPVAVMVNPDGPYQTMEQLIDAAKAGVINAGGPPPGSLPHAAQAAIAQLYGVEFNYVPFESGVGAVTAVKANDIAFTTEPFGTASLVGLKPVAILGPNRVEELPDVPSINEINADSKMDFSIWFGLFAPAGTPENIVSTLSDACGAATESASFVDGIKAINWNVKYLNAADFTTFFNEQYSSLGELMKQLGMKNN